MKNRAEQEQAQEFVDRQYREGRLLPVTAAPMTPEARAELERLIDVHSTGQPATEILLEERQDGRD